MERTTLSTEVTDETMVFFGIRAGTVLLVLMLIHTPGTMLVKLLLCFLPYDFKINIKGIIEPQMECTPLPPNALWFV